MTDIQLFKSFVMDVSNIFTSCSILGYKHKSGYAFSLFWRFPNFYYLLQLFSTNLPFANFTFLQHDNKMWKK